MWNRISRRLNVRECAWVCRTSLEIIHCYWNRPEPSHSPFRKPEVATGNLLRSFLPSCTCSVRCFTWNQSFDRHGHCAVIWNLLSANSMEFSVSREEDLTYYRVLDGDLLIIDLLLFNQMWNCQGSSIFIESRTVLTILINNFEIGIENDLSSFFMKIVSCKKVYYLLPSAQLDINDTDNEIDNCIWLRCDFTFHLILHWFHRFYNLKKFSAVYYLRAPHL